MYILFDCVALLGLLVVPVSFIVWLVLKIRKKPSAKHWKWIACISLVVTVICFAVGLSITPEPTSPPADGTEEETVENITNDEIIGETIDELMPEITAETSPFVEKLMSFGFTEEEATENAKILIQCGIPNISICEPTDPNATIDGLVSYRGKLDDDRTVWFTVENRKIFYVSLNGEDLYDGDKGGYLKNFDEVHIPETNISVTVSYELRNKTESILDGYFASSRYYDAWGFAREDNNYMVQCQATDGSMLTSNWLNCRVWYEQQDNGDFVVTGVQINGKQYKLK